LFKSPRDDRQSQAPAGEDVDDMAVAPVIHVSQMPEKPLSVRFDTETVARLERAAEALTVRSAGLSIGRPSVIKLAVERGLPLLEAELGLVRRKPKPKTKRTAR
jgi:hypothetical protein